MIIKRNFHPLRVWGYIKIPVLIALLWSLIIWLLYTVLGASFLVWSFTPVGVLGSALAIFVAFRNNSAYGRWWEARTLWGGIVNSSRVLARLIITFADSHSHQPQYEWEKSERFKKIMVYRCIAWVHALRMHLRNDFDLKPFESLLSAEELVQLQVAQNRPNYLQLLIGRGIYGAMADGTLGGFDSFQMEGQLLALANYQGGCERIKNTPLPRQYDFFTRIFVTLFSFLLPFGLLGLFQGESFFYFDWIIIPLTVLISGVFIVMERTGAANEDPFEGKVTDVPLSALCNTIERDLREMLGETHLPEKHKAEKGYLM